MPDQAAITESLQWLQSPEADELTRAQAVLVLEEVAEDWIESFLIHLLLRDTHRKVRANSATILGIRRLRSSVAALSEALTNDPDPEVRELSAVALGRIGDFRAIHVLMTGLRNDADSDTREKCAEALAAMPNLPETLRLLQDSIALETDPGVIQYLLRGIQSIKTAVRSN